MIVLEYPHFLKMVHFIHRKKESRDTEQLICISTYHQKQETVFLIWASQLTPKHQLSWLPKEKKNQNKQNTHIHTRTNERAEKHKPLDVVSNQVLCKIMEQGNHYSHIINHRERR